MKITYKGDYALKVVIELARLPEGGIVTIAGLATKLDIPQKFLEQVLLDLKKGGVLQSRRGKQGGYALARSADTIRVGDIVRLIDNPIEPIACVDNGYDGCRDMTRCLVRPLFVKAHQAVTDILDEATIGSLLRQAQNQQIAFDI